MTVSAQTTLFSYVGNGFTTLFPYTCQVQKAADITVYANGVKLTSGYTVAGVGSLTGGNVEFAVAPALGVQIIVVRIVVLERTVDYQQNGDFLAAVVNRELDRIWMALQQQVTSQQSFLHYPVAEVGAISELPALAVRAGKIMAFNNSGNPIALDPPPGSAAEFIALLNQRVRMGTGVGQNDNVVAIGNRPDGRPSMTVEGTDLGPLALANGVDNLFTGKQTFLAGADISMFANIIDATGGNAILQFQTTAGARTLVQGGNGWFFLSTTNATIASLNNGGDLSVRSLTETSDENKKKDWTPLTDAQLDALADMTNVGVFTWKNDPDNKKSVGGSAQQIQAIVPEAVVDDGMGNLSVQYGGLCFAMIQGTMRRLKTIL